MVCVILIDQEMEWIVIVYAIVANSSALFYGANISMHHTRVPV